MDEVQELLLVHQAISGRWGIKSWKSCLQNCNCKEINEPGSLCRIVQKIRAWIFLVILITFTLGLAIYYKDFFFAANLFFQAESIH